MLYSGGFEISEYLGVDKNYEEFACAKNMNAI